MTRTLIERNDIIAENTNCRTNRQPSYTAPAFDSYDEAVCDMADISFKHRNVSSAASLLSLPLMAAVSGITSLFIK